MPPFLKISVPSLALGFIFILAVIVTAGVISFITGNRSRSYRALSPFASVVISEKSVSLDDLARSFKPELFLSPGDSSPPALEMLWEAVDAGDSIALIYHPVWQDERHPSPILHWIYYAYRAIVYGVPVRDIEYIQVNVSKAGGFIKKIRYEGSSSSIYNSWLVNHTMVTIEKNGDIYVETVISSGIPAHVNDVQIIGPNLGFGIESWSHQFKLLNNNSRSKYTIPVTMPIKPLTETDYAKYKLARRSQGDFVTEDSIIGRSAKSVMGILVLGVPYIVSKFLDNGR